MAKFRFKIEPKWSYFGRVLNQCDCVDYMLIQTGYIKVQRPMLNGNVYGQC